VRALLHPLDALIVVPSALWRAVAFIEAHAARRWGWASPSHFAAAYLKAYGRHPRHTLRA